jgi:hypothetical protein
MLIIRGMTVCIGRDIATGHEERDVNASHPYRTGIP